MEVAVAKFDVLTRYCCEGSEEYRYKRWSRGWYFNLSKTAKLNTDAQRSWKHFVRWVVLASRTAVCVCVVFMRVSHSNNYTS